MNIYLILGALVLLVILFIYLSSGSAARQEARTDRTVKRQDAKTDRVVARQETKLTKQQQKTCRTALRQSRRRRGSQVQIPSYCK